MDQPRSHGNREFVDYHKGLGGIQATIKRWKPEVSSMPHHIEEVIDSKGTHSKYWKVVSLTILDNNTFQIEFFSS